jgi:hypothetical protein
MCRETEIHHTGADGGKQGAAPASLEALLETANARTAQNVLQRMTININPILEKGMLDPELVHRWAITSAARLNPCV